jgi:hypothetical protein
MPIASATQHRNISIRTLLIELAQRRNRERDMTGTLIVAAMETSLLTLQATKVMVMPLLALIDGGKAARPYADFLSCDDLRALIRELPSLIFHAEAID